MPTGECSLYLAKSLLSPSGWGAPPPGEGKAGPWARGRWGVFLLMLCTPPWGWGGIWGLGCATDGGMGWEGVPDLPGVAEGREGPLG